MAEGESGAASSVTATATAAAAAAAAAAATDRPPATKRIYIGGVSESVTAADVEKTFSSLGTVAAVEFVRTNGRSFAYMNFQPNSDKSLAKLFSTYNRCTWKGGKLRLEVAKEHYLVRLKREWAEDAKVVPTTPFNPDIEKKAANSKSESLSQENMQLRIFFPKLRKVKPVPFKGTGKHKYSFQRIEVPPLPIHFCDCEEHRGPSETASQKYLSSIQTGIYYEKELNIMNSVMNKLFQKEDNEVTADRMVDLATGANISDRSISKFNSEESEEALEMDDDNLVTNIGMKRIDDMLMQLKGRETQPVHQELQPSKHVSTQNKANSQKKLKAAPVGASQVTLSETVPSTLAGKSTEDKFTAILPQNITPGGHPQEPENSVEPLMDGSKTDSSTCTAQSEKHRSWVQKSSWRDLVGVAGNSSFSISHVLPGITQASPKLLESNNSPVVISAPAKKPKAQRVKGKSKPLPVVQDAALEKAVAADDIQVSGKDDAICANQGADEHKESPKKSSRMSHKSSWRDLVGVTGTSSFSISQVLPGISPESPKLPESNDSPVIISAAAKKLKAQPIKGEFKSFPVMQDAPLEKAAAAGDIQISGKEDTTQANQRADMHRESSKNGEQEYRRSIPKIEIGGVCTFMRSEESKREYAKARASLSGFFKRKKKKETEENDAPKSFKGMPPRKRMKT